MTVRSIAVWNEALISTPVSSVSLPLPRVAGRDLACRYEPADVTGMGRLPTGAIHCSNLGGHAMPGTSRSCMRCTPGCSTVGFFEVSWFGVMLAIDQAVDSVGLSLMLALPVVIALRIGGWRALWHAPVTPTHDGSV